MITAKENFMHGISSIIDAIEQCADGESTCDIDHIFDELQRIAPYQSALYGYLKLVEGQPKISHLHTYNVDENWLRYYRSHDLVKNDPVVGRALSENRAFTWEHTQASHPSNETMFASQLKRERGRFGVAYSYPHNENSHRAFLSLQFTNSSFPQLYWRTLVECLLPHIHNACQKRAEYQVTVSVLKKPLTKKESFVLKYARDGKTTTEIGNELYISPNTVKFHFKNIFEKLSVTNRSHAVAKAISLGLITSENHNETVS